jgi:hypothetical protein
MYSVGADPILIHRGSVFGRRQDISGRSAVRDLFPKRRPTMSELVHDLV